MVRFSLTPALLLLSLFFASCSGGHRGGSKGGTETDALPVVAVSVAPQAWFVDRIAAGQVSVQVMVPSGGNPEEYDPSPSDIARLEESDLFIYTGTLPFEERWISRISGGRTALVNLSEKLPRALLHPESGNESSHDSHGHAGGDPHFWSSFDGGRALARATFEELSLILPQDSSGMRIRLDSLITEIDHLEHRSRELLKGSPTTHAFLIYHPSLTAYAKEMGLRQIVVQEEGKEPSPGHLASVLDEARRLGVRVVLVQEEFNPSGARALAGEIGAKTVSINPYDYDWASQISRIAEALSESTSPD